MQYRPDVDGLRAVAVGSVVLYHAGIWPFSGGFVGVDVFFVISGFLITGIIVDDLERGRFSIAHFYDRRIRRIFPALFATLLACSIAAYFILLPSYFENYSESLFSTSVFLSNVYFWRESGYFDIDSELKPLLHTWSLAVEEQFYIFFPPLLMVVHRWFRRLLVPIVVAIAVLSFALGAYFVHTAPTAAFYLTPLRVWELMAGSLLALNAVPALHAAWQREAAATAGIALIGIAVFAFNHDTPFPGAAALLPVVGTVLLIHAGRDGASRVGSVLALRPVVGLGLISYSLYLFHWPILVFYRHAAGDSGDVATRWVLVLASVALAWLSLRWLEQPFRRRTAESKRIRVFAGGTAVAVVCLAAGLAGNASGGWPARFDFRFEPATVMATGQGEIRKILKGVRCRAIDGGAILVDGAACDERTGARPQIAVLGDSHSAHLYPGLVAAFPDIDFQLYGSGGCRVLHGVDTRPDEKECRVMTPYVYDRLLPNRKFDAIIMASSWQRGDPPLVRESLDVLKRYADNIVVVGPVPRYKVNLPELLAIWQGDYTKKFFALNLDRAVAGIDERLQHDVDAAGIPYVSVYRRLCEDGRCRTFAEDGQPMQWDRAHLTASGSRYVVDNIIAPVLRHYPPFAASRRAEGG